VATQAATIKDLNIASGVVLMARERKYVKMA
jgi:hypothetical protein